MIEIIGRKAMLNFLDRQSVIARDKGQVNYSPSCADDFLTIKYTETNGSVTFTLQNYCNTIDRTMRRVKQSPVNRARNPATLRLVPVRDEEAED